MKNIIEQIHNDFDSAHIKLLDEAKKIISKESEQLTKEEQRIIRLKTIGFTQALSVNQTVQKVNLSVKNKEQADLIQYYQQTYPFLQFITESEINRICNKYNLIHAPVSHYTGDVPEKNLIDIENAQPLKFEDKNLNISRIIIDDFWSDCPRQLKQFLKDTVIQTTKELNKIPIDSDIESLIRQAGYTGDFGQFIYRTGHIETIDYNGFFICAPKSSFNLKGLDKRKLGYFSILRTEIKDPVVFRYVKGGCQIITKWGLEASDKGLINPINN